MPMHPTYDGALRLVGDFAGALEVPLVNNMLMIPQAHVGPVKADVEGGTAHKDIMLANFNASAGAIELFNLGLRASGAGFITTTYAEEYGAKPVIILSAPDGMQSHGVRDGIRDAAKHIGEGWVKDGDGYIKIFPANDPIVKTNIAEDHQGQRALLNAVIDPDGIAPAVKAIFMAADGRRLEGAEADDWNNVKKIALKITTRQANLVNSELGTAIGISK